MVKTSEALVSGHGSCVTWPTPTITLGKQFVTTWKGAEVAAGAEGYSPHHPRGMATLLLLQPR